MTTTGKTASKTRTRGAAKSRSTTPRRRSSPRTATTAKAREALDNPWILGALGALIAGGATALALATRRLTRADEGHVPADLLGDTHPGPNDRAPEAFRPDPTAPVGAADREALRPATIPA